MKHGEYLWIMRDQLIQSGGYIGFYLILPFPVNPLGQNSFITKTKGPFTQISPSPLSCAVGGPGESCTAPGLAQGLCAPGERTGLCTKVGQLARVHESSGDRGNLFPSKTMTNK